MTLEIISSHEVLYKGDADMVTLPGEMGRFTVLRNHASIISVLVPGDIRFRKEGDKEHSYHINGGLVDVDNNVVSVCIY
ncbi:MAG: ATP synthase F1 subunit epsilon [Muribaculaceae bacterium]|nr:ATP synthase F1 subunit epsilon [Muribaculaceae bacterium]